MASVLISILAVLAIIYIVPIVVYGLFSALANLKMPEGASLSRFLISVLVSKVGTAIGFVLLFYFARDFFSNQWFLYALIWWTMFALGEIGQAIGPNYTWKEAIAGVISEAIYFPLSAFIANWLLL